MPRTIQRSTTSRARLPIVLPVDVPIETVRRIRRGMDVAAEGSYGDRMVRYTCSECGGDVTIDTSHLGPWGGRGLQSPVRILCFDCVRRLGLELRGDGAHRWFLRGGEEWREYPGAFARSDDPSVRGIYHRDER